MTAENYIIAMTSRVGSTWLTRLLEANGCLKPREYFNLSNSYPGHTVKVRAGWILEHQPIGVKCNCRQLVRYLPHMGEGFFDRCRFLWLRRREIWRQAISEYVSSVTGISHIAIDDDYRHPEIPYDAEQIHAAAINCLASNEAWRMWFFQRDIQPTEIFYEELVENPAFTLKRAIRGIGRPVPKEVAIVEPFARTKIPAADQWCERLLDTYGDLST